MTRRECISNRREAETFDFECHGVAYTASVGRFADVHELADAVDEALEKAIELGLIEPQ